MASIKYRFGSAFKSYLPQNLVTNFHSKYYPLKLYILIIFAYVDDIIIYAHYIIIKIIFSNISFKFLSPK